MKKFTLFTVFVMLAAFTFGQVADVQLPTKSKKQKTKQFSQVAQKEAVWEVNFEETEPQYTLGHTLGTRDWTVDDTTSSTTTFENGVDFDDPDLPAGTLVTAMWLYMGRTTVGDYSESGGNFAWIDGITYLLEGTYENVNAYIQFDNIDLSEVDNPMLSFTQNYKTFNDDRCYIDYSLDGGDTWEDSIEINTEPEVNNYAADDFFIILTNYVANEPDVSLRIRWYAPDNTASGPEYSGGYGWQIDDLKITAVPEIDMKLISAHMNFFEYIDYTDPANVDYFHSSSHLGMIPQEQFASDMAAMVWNGIIENNGYADNAPEFNVTVLDPTETEVYNESVTGPTLSVTQKDTVDLLTPEFTLTDPALGTYTVIYNVNMAGDVDLTDNADTTYFIVTDSTFARDLDNITSYVTPGSWSNGGNDGEMIGTNYTYLYDTQVKSMAAYITSNTSEGTSIVYHLMEFNSETEEWDDIMTTPLTNLTAEDIGGWLEIDFPEPVDIITEEGYKTVKASVELYYNDEENEIGIGVDRTVPSSFWGTQWYMLEGSSANSWVAYGNWNDGGIGLRLNYDAPSAISEINTENLNVYPNPTTGIVRIDNVEGNDIEVYNLVGQRVFSDKNVDNNVKLNLSNQSEGTYLIRVIGTNGVKTQKINLIK